MSTPVFKNAQLVLPHEVVRGSVSVADGLITAVEQGPASHAQVCDLEGD